MASASSENSPARLALKLTGYFVIVIGLLVVIVIARPDMIRHLPVGGTDAMAVQDVADMKEFVLNRSSGDEAGKRLAPVDEDQVDRVLRIAGFMFGHLGGTILIMLPIAWTFKAIKFDAGFNKNFVRSLIILPICATTTVLLIQDSLALAFGLAALVAAVRFRVALEDAMDGIFIFAAICAGLAAGIGYLGVALIMCMFFCYTNLILWRLDFGSNPVDEARRDRKRSKQLNPVVDKIA